MDNKQFIILIAVVLICCCIVAGAIYFGLSNQKPTVNTTANVTAENNTTNITANLTEDAQNSDSNVVEISKDDERYNELNGYRTEFQACRHGVAGRICDLCERGL